MKKLNYCYDMPSFPDIILDIASYKQSMERYDRLTEVPVKYEKAYEALRKWKNMWASEAGKTLLCLRYLQYRKWLQSKEMTPYLEEKHTENLADMTMLSVDGFLTPHIMLCPCSMGADTEMVYDREYLENVAKNPGVLIPKLEARLPELISDLKKAIGATREVEKLLAAEDASMFDVLMSPAKEKAESWDSRVDFEELERKKMTIRRGRSKSKPTPSGDLSFEDYLSILSD